MPRAPWSRSQGKSGLRYAPPPAQKKKQPPVTAAVARTTAAAQPARPAARPTMPRIIEPMKPRPSAIKAQPRPAPTAPPAPRTAIPLTQPARMPTQPVRSVLSPLAATAAAAPVKEQPKPATQAQARATAVVQQALSAIKVEAASPKIAAAAKQVIAATSTPPPAAVAVVNKAIADRTLKVSTPDPVTTAATKQVIAGAIMPNNPVNRQLADLPPADLTTAKLIAALSSNVAVPVWDYDDEVLSARTIPSDKYAELNLFALFELYYQAGAITPAAPVTGSRSTAGDIVLARADAVKTPQIVPGVLLEFSLTETSSTLGQFSGSVAGWYWSGRGIPLSAGPAVDAPASDFASGSFTFVPRTAKTKGTVLMTPYRVVNGKTYITPLVLAPAYVVSSAAAPITVTVSTLPSNALVEATALGVDHDFFKRIAQQLQVELD